MSFTDKLVLWLHIGFAIFTIGPLAVAISSTPRYIRKREIAILRYLSRITVIFTAAALLVFVFGVVLGQLDHDFGHAWLTVAMTLFVVALVLLVLVVRDQRRAIKALAPAEMPADAAAPDDSASDDSPSLDSAGHESASQSAAAVAAAHIATVERGRIAAMGGIVNLIWLVILVLMVWQP
ncbi:MAG TPA: hypothetical protein VMB74_20030 [Streptosporangiaceae bacterium]|nr:hypothetical protein [Streptosporangiaceae bacterium]